MSTWDEIACQRGHTTHATRQVTVDLSQPHGYGDYPQVPARLARAFEMFVYPPDVYGVDGGPYCPAFDAVSETIISHGIWEPRETILTLTVCESAIEEHSFLLDFGAQLGWFSLLAASCGVHALAFDADAVNVETLKRSAALNPWGEHIVCPPAERIGPESPQFVPGAPGPIRLAKIDVEGAEDHVIRSLWPSIEAGNVDHLLIEISPVFADYYPDLVASLIDAGYEAYLLPPKQSPPLLLDDPEHDLAPFRLDTMRAHRLRQTVSEWHQEDVWMKRRDASW
jgi:hypothetical protein